MLTNRRHFLSTLPAIAAGAFFAHGTASSASAAFVRNTSYKGRLPFDTAFNGESKFQALCAQASRGNWAALPLGQRTVTVGRALLGTKYGNYTLEIDDHVEAPSVNLYTLDCWTFYECSLAFSRMIRYTPQPWTPVDMLQFIELERYRDGRCDGSYLSRMHHLEEVFSNNQQRGLGTNITRSLGGVPIRRNITEMQIAWKQYRYLKNNPSYRTGIARVEARVSRLPVTYIPKSRVARIESSLQDGDVLAVVARDDTGYTSHVGLGVRSGSTCRFMHATSSRDKGRCCIVDERISSYLADKPASIGLIVFRPER